MLAMQYSIHLPANYDAALIHNRVNERKALFDDHAGLMHKSFLYNEKEKVYAPFYVWKDATEAKDFLIDDLFQGVTETFSRHRVRSWYVLAMAYGNRTIKPAHAQREVDILSPDETIKQHVAREQHLQHDLLKDPNLYMHLIALDAACWEVLHFSLWKDKESAVKPHGDSSQIYEVLHVTQPKT